MFNLMLSEIFVDLVYVSNDLHRLRRIVVKVNFLFLVVFQDNRWLTRDYHTAGFAMSSEQAYKLFCPSDARLSFEKWRINAFMIFDVHIGLKVVYDKHQVFVI